MATRTREVRMRLDPVLVELAGRCHLRLADVLEHGIMNRLGITRKELITHRQLYDTRHSMKRPVRRATRVVVYNGGDGKEYCIDD